jgi:hypothetical protein
MRGLMHDKFVNDYQPILKLLLLNSSNDEDSSRKATPSTIDSHSGSIIL